MEERGCLSRRRQLEGKNEIAGQRGVRSLGRTGERNMLKPLRGWNGIIKELRRRR